jgi:hypothetical protein
VSVDGKRITFRSSRDRNQEVYVMNADGSAQTTLTRDPAEDNDSTWPAGQKRGGEPTGERLRRASKGSISRVLFRTALVLADRGLPADPFVEYPRGVFGMYSMQARR